VNHEKYQQYEYFTNCLRSRRFFTLHRLQQQGVQQLLYRIAMSRQKYFLHFTLTLLLWTLGRAAPGLEKNYCHTAASKGSSVESCRVIEINSGNGSYGCATV